MYTYVGEGKLTLYQVVATFKGSENGNEIVLNKNTEVKVLDKKDHGMSAWLCMMNCEVATLRAGVEYFC